MVSTAVVPYSPRSPCTTSPLGPLPNEIIYMVFEQLTYPWQLGDIARLRLVCKLFAEIGNYFLLSEVNLFFKSSQFERLRQISEHPIISKKVDTLFYEADILTEYGSMQEWKENICVPGWMGNLPEGLHLPPPGASERAKRAYNRELDKAMHGPKFTHSDKLLKRAYKAYTRHLADQELMRTQDYKLQILKDAMMKMPNLKTIEMSTECCLNNGRSTRMEKAFEDGLVSPYGDRQTDEGCGVGQLRSLLLAMEAAGLALETLAVGNLDWRFFMETGKQNIEVMQKMRGALRSLRTLRLYVSAHSEDDDDYNYFRHDMIIPECAKYLHETSHLRDFVTATPDLERLDFNFDCGDPFPPASLCDSIGTFTWHSLRVAAFAYISADEDYLVSFFERHASSLRKIRLDCMNLTTGWWPSLLKRARKALKLEQAAIFGRLTSGSLTSFDPEECYYFDLPPGMNGGKKAMIGDVVEKYLLKGGDGPLLKLHELAQKHSGTYVHPDEDPSPYLDTESDEVIMDRF